MKGHQLDKQQSAKITYDWRRITVPLLIDVTDIDPTQLLSLPFSTDINKWYFWGSKYIDAVSNLVVM